jgi:hypothetical protein
MKVSPIIWPLHTPEQTWCSFRRWTFV